MAQRIVPSDLYRAGRERVAALASAADDLSVPVPATPGWAVHDLLAHVVGVAEDVADGSAPDDPDEQWTASHLARLGGLPCAELLARWQAAAPATERFVDGGGGVWPPVMDLGAHEFDLRGALGDTGGRDAPIVVLGAKLLLSGLRVPTPLRVITEHHDVLVGPRGRLARAAACGTRAGPDAAATDAADATAQIDPVVLRTTDFEAFRWRLGRRSPAQLRAMDWSADPEPFLPSLCRFGPAVRDVVE